MNDHTILIVFSLFICFEYCSASDRGKKIATGNPTEEEKSLIKTLEALNKDTETFLKDKTKKLDGENSQYSYKRESGKNGKEIAKQYRIIYNESKKLAEADKKGPLNKAYTLFESELRNIQRSREDSE